MQAIQSTLIDEIEQYWTRRASSYSDVVQREQKNGSEKTWMSVITENIPRSRFLRILDIGTGPGFFAIGLARRGYDVTAVDYTEAMLDEARQNAGQLRDSINFSRMDAHSLDLPDGSFDAIVTRNLTWNLERSQDAYADWRRVLRPGGVMLNFDAGWYSYLFDDHKAAEVRKDRDRVAELGVIDFNDYSEGARMEDISRNLTISRCQRPQADIRMLKAAGFSAVSADTSIGDRVWDEEEKINYRSTPLFMLKAVN